MSHSLLVPSLHLVFFFWLLFVFSGEGADEEL